MGEEEEEEAQAHGPLRKGLQSSEAHSKLSCCKQLCTLTPAHACFDMASAKCRLATPKHNMPRGAGSLALSPLPAPGNSANMTMWLQLCGHPGGDVPHLPPGRKGEPEKSPATPHHCLGSR